MVSCAKLPTNTGNSSNEVSYPPLPQHTVELWPVDKLIPYARNARTHSPEQVDKIAASIIEFGFTNPILVDGNHGIIAGHGRLLAARKLELKEVPVIQLAHLTDTQKRAYIIADNRLALDAGWDRELLASELEELQADDFDLSLMGFSEQDLAGIFLEYEEGHTDPNREWTGMPEFNQQDLTAYRSLKINFSSQEDVNNFAHLVGQVITDKTRSIWYPAAEIGTIADKRYEQE